jgi:hypothetical protein
MWSAVSDAATAVIVSAVVVVVAVVVSGVYVSWHRFVTEEEVCGVFTPVITALGDWQKESGSLPTNLLQLVPRYLPRLPRSPVADSVDYRARPDGTSWELSVHSRALRQPRVYIYRSSRQFTDEERKQSVTAFHGWVVFRRR